MAVVSQLRAVVFDLDGLMFNTEELYQYVGGEILRRRGKTFDADLLDKMMGRQPQVALQYMIDWHGLDATPAELAAEGEQIFATILDTRLECMPGLVDLLDALEKHRIPKAIATSSGAMMSAGRKFAMRGRLMSSKVKPSPSKISPPTAVISLIMGVVIT